MRCDGHYKLRQPQHLVLMALASGLIRSRTTLTSEQNPKTILKLRLAKGEITKDAYLELLRLLSE